MPRRTDLNHILVIGSGPIVIGQACEFDYSGTQACRVLRAEGLQVSLVNSNPATIMTDPEFADHTYVEPITPAFVERVIAQQVQRGNKIDALLATLGGQTALNTAVALYENGVLEKYGVELIGADFDAIQRGEDRQRFKDIVAKVGGESARSRVCFTMGEVTETVDELGLPVVVRPSFTMGGLGAGMERSVEEVDRMAGAGLAASPSANVLIEESIYGWKKFELELMRDGKDNVVVVCSIENVDPMGVHTGDSVTVAPAMTLTDREYQRMRDLGIAILREVGVDTGGCNIQFAVDPADGRLVVVEMNPRVSRSSALASKATGFPIAKIAAKLAIGYTLDEIVNDITKETPACFEPTLDYVVVKAPRFAFEKFPGAAPTLTTTMKSVGEAMSLGRNFIEALGKVMRSLETPRAGFWTKADAEGDVQEVLTRLQTPTEGRLYDIELALRLGASIEQVAQASGVDPWFVAQIGELGKLRAELVDAPVLDGDLLRRGKHSGLSDRQIAALRPELAGEDGVRSLRTRLDIHPVYKTVDTCAGEFEAKTPYHYSSYEVDPAAETEVAPQTEKPKVLILGSGPNRIGQGIEFDYSCVHAATTLSEAGFETVMVNCNPETVSTDYDTADRLYFEPLTFEDVLEVFHAEERSGAGGPGVVGVIVQLGGQTPLGLAQRLADEGVPIVGTPPEAIDLAEDRGAFGDLLSGGGPAGSPLRHGDDVRAGPADCRRHRLSGPGSAVLRPRRARHGDRLRRRNAAGLHRPGHRAVARTPGSGGPLPGGRDRDRRRRTLRRRRGLHRRHHGAHRRGRDSLRRLGLCAASGHPGPQRHREGAHSDRGDRARYRRDRAAQCAVRVEGRRALRAGGQPARQSHRAVRLQGHRHTAGQGVCPDHAGRQDLSAPRRRTTSGYRRRRPRRAERADRREGGGAAVPPVPPRRRLGCGLAAGPRDEIDR